LNASEIVSAASAIGVRLLVRDGKILAEPSGLLPDDLRAEIREQKSDLVQSLAPPACYRCGTPVAAPNDLLCQPCYVARRSPGRVLPFDPGRRRRTEARLAVTRCKPCGGSWWRVYPNGDAECEPCRRERAATTDTRTDGAPAAGGAR